MTTIVEPFELHLGIKSSTEQTIDGVVGLVTEGYASEYGVMDQAGEYQAPGSLADVVDAWGRQAQPLVDYDHGFDPILGAAPIGRGLEWKLDARGLYCKCFLPRDPTPPFQHDAARKTARWAQVYEGVKSGRIRGYSVTGIFAKAGNALVRWSMNSLAITPRPCLASAQFVLGAKAVGAYLDAPLLGAKDSLLGPDDPQPASGVLTEQGSAGVLSRPSFDQVMKLAQRHKDHGLHDHLLGRPPELQGAHDSGDCPVCDARRTGMGLKAAAHDGPTPAGPLVGDPRPLLPAPEQARVLALVAGLKAGKTHSKETLAAVTRVLDILTTTFGLTGVDEPDADDASAS